MKLRIGRDRQGSICVRAPFGAPAEIRQHGVRQVGSFFYRTLGLRQRLMRPGKYSIQWGQSQFTLEVHQ